jgi:hypothetical protein
LASEGKIEVRDVFGEIRGEIMGEAEGVLLKDVRALVLLVLLII